MNFYLLKTLPFLAAANIQPFLIPAMFFFIFLKKISKQYKHYNFNELITVNVTVFSGCKYTTYT